MHLLQRFVGRMRMLSLLAPMLLFDNSRLMLAPEINLTLPHLTSTTHTLHYNTLIALDIFS